MDSLTLTSALFVIVSTVVIFVFMIVFIIDWLSPLTHLNSNNSVPGTENLQRPATLQSSTVPVDLQLGEGVKEHGDAKQNEKEHGVLKSKSKIALWARSMSPTNNSSVSKQSDLPSSLAVNWRRLYRSWFQLKNLLNLGRIGVLIASLMYIGPYSCAYFSLQFTQSSCDAIQFVANFGYYLSRFLVIFFYIGRLKTIIYSSHKQIQRISSGFSCLNVISFIFSMIELANEVPILNEDGTCYITTQYPGIIGWMGFFFITLLMDFGLLVVFTKTLGDILKTTPDSDLDKLTRKTRITCAVAIVMSVICNSLYTFLFYFVDPEEIEEYWFRIYDVTTALDTFTTAFAVIFVYSRFFAMWKSTLHCLLCFRLRSVVD